MGFIRSQNPVVDVQKMTHMIDVKVIHIGVVQSLVQEFTTHRLPGLLRLKDKVDSSE